MAEKTEFDALFDNCGGAVQRLVNFRIGNRMDAEDVLQEVCLAAFLGFDALQDKSRFKPWLLAIARNKINDYFRRLSKSFEIPLNENMRYIDTHNRMGVTAQETVAETLSALGSNDSRILYLYYLKNKPQAEIAKLLDIPLGTVKSRLHMAKKRFINQYPYPPKAKGDYIMKEMPKKLPEYQITKSEKPPFEVRWEELLGWFIVPREGEKCAWAMYDFPERTRTEHTYMEVVGKAMVHGIEGVEIDTVEKSPMDCNKTDSAGPQRRFVAQLTATHCRILAESHIQGGVKRYYTFLDGDEFLQNWGFGDDNCGHETELSPKGLIRRDGDRVACDQSRAVLDLAGRYDLTIGGRYYDTMCLMDVECYNEGVLSEQYIDKEGRTILWRRFNKDDWAFGRYGQLWSERLPGNEKRMVNGEPYVHWYDCITDYILK